LPPESGWESAPPVDLDGKNWTLGFAAKYLDVPEVLLRELIRYTGLSPAGTLNMREFRTQGRTARAYAAGRLIAYAEVLAEMREGS